MSQSGHHADDPLAKLMPPEIHIPPLQIAGHEYPIMDLTMFGLVFVVFLFVTLHVRKHLKNPNSRLVTLMEMVVEFIEDQCTTLMGAEGKKYIPFFATLFTVLLVGNVIGLIPWLKSPTASLHVNAALAAIVFLTTHVMGVKKKGIGYFKHFFQPFWFMFPLHLIDELVKPITLTVRLFINMFSKEILLGAFGFMFTLLASAATTSERAMMALPFAIKAIIVLLGVVIGAVQALVFTLLSIVYVAMAIESHDDHEHAEHPHAPAAGHQHA